MRLILAAALLMGAAPVAASIWVQNPDSSGPAKDFHIRLKAETPIKPDLKPPLLIDGKPAAISPDGAHIALNINVPGGGKFGLDDRFGFFKTGRELPNGYGAIDSICFSTDGKGISGVCDPNLQKPKLSIKPDKGLEGPYRTLEEWGSMGISFGVVPEPSSWAMLISGFGLVGAALRRRRAMPA